MQHYAHDVAFAYFTRSLHLHSSDAPLFRSAGYTAGNGDTVSDTGSARILAVWLGMRSEPSTGKL